MAQQNFYEELDLRYPEIAIAMTRIDRMNPGKIPFAIPVLTPNMNTSTMNSSKVIQKDKSKLQNVDKNSVDVSNIELSNTISIEVPKELCTLPGAIYDIVGDVNLSGSYSMTGEGNTKINGTIEGSGSGSISGNETISGLSLSANSGSIRFEQSNQIESFYIIGASGNGSNSISGSASVDLQGSVSGSQTSDSTGNITVDGIINGTITATLNDKNRYIPAKSKWLVVFVGGDINMPRIIAKIPDSD